MGTQGSGSLVFNESFNLNANGAVLVNCNSSTFVFNAQLGFLLTPCTWSLQQYADMPPTQFTTLISSPWTDVTITQLGRDRRHDADYAGNLVDPVALPYALVYRNGTLWNGTINITNGGRLWAISLSI